MSSTLVLPRFSIGVGDRFAHQAAAQLTACQRALEQGVEVVPVWNKSNREHTIIGSEPSETRRAADAAVHELGWRQPYFLDADHINRGTVDRFLQPCDFFTIDVADQIGHAASESACSAFVNRHPELLGTLTIPGIAESFAINEAMIRSVAGTFLLAVESAGEIYRYIADRKGVGTFITEVSMDETDRPQTPVELLIILVAIAEQGIPLQTIAPKFTGRFNKGVDYSGDVARFDQEFTQDIAAINFAIRNYSLPSNLKLSVHSGSDKFSIYPAIHRAITETGAGLHLKTAGTTWLEELIGLAESGNDGLAIAKDIYRDAYEHKDDLTRPYASVIDIDAASLPSPRLLNTWSSEQFTRALRHNPRDLSYNPSLRQLLHVGFKVAAKMDKLYLNALQEHRDVIGRNVTENLFARHIEPVFLGASRLKELA